MRHLSALGVLLLIFAVSISYAGNKDIGYYCRKLDGELSVSKDRRIEKWSTLVLKKFWWNLPGHVGFEKVARLVRALATVADSTLCNERSLEVVATSIRCKSGMTRNREILDEAIKNYEKNCLTSNYLDKKIESVTSCRSTEGIKEFMNEKFLATYRKDNPNEIFFDKSNVVYLYCRLMRAQDSIINALHWHKPLYPHYITDLELLKNKLNKHMFEPCKNYRDHATAVMHDIFNVTSSEPFEWIGSVINSLSQESKDAICRFNMCDKLQYWRDELVEDLAKKLHIYP